MINFLKKFKDWHFVLFSTLITIWIGLFYTSSEFIYSPVIGIKDMLILIAHWSFVMIAVFFLIHLLAINKYIFAIIFPLVIFISSILAYFRFTINSAFTSLVLDAALDNDVRITLELISVNLILFSLLSTAMAVYTVIYRFKKIRIAKTVIHFFISSIVLIYIFKFTPISRPIKERIPFNMYFTTQKYLAEKKVVQKERPQLNSNLNCEVVNDDITVVFVLGESLRPDHLGINGYIRNTTPQLQKKNVISLPKIYSPYTYTNNSVPYIMTRAGKKNLNLGYTERSFIDLFNSCGFKTAWLGNQDAAETYAYFAHETDTTVFVNTDKGTYNFDVWLDEDLFPAYYELIEENSKQLIILHTVGSHWWYKSHYSPEFEIFKPVLKSRIVSANTSEEIINSYDNTILYTDNFLSQLITTLEDKNAILIFLSDHGENLGEDNMWLHANETAFAKNPAAFIWMSEKYKDLYPRKLERLLENKNKEYDTEFLFHSILDASNISTEYLEKELSVFE